MWRRSGEIGQAGERAAERYLRRRGYVILERNFRSAGGEVDLVALHRDEVVFVEVKTRAAQGDEPVEAVDARKRGRILRAARSYVARRRLEDRYLRFDIVAVRRNGRRFECRLIADAFGADDAAPRSGPKP